MAIRYLAATFVSIAMLCTSGAAAQSIADTVKRERERQEKTKASKKSYTEADLKALPVGSSVTTGQSKAESPDPRRKTGASGVTTVPIERRGNTMVVSVNLNDHVQTKMIVDTGASITSISIRVADSLGIKIDDRTTRMPTQTANGPALVPLVKLSSLRVGDVEIRDVDVLVMTNWPNPEVTGLLGMNFFGQFDWSTDAVNNQLVLRPLTSHPQAESYGGYDKEWWQTRFRYVLGPLDQLREELRKAEATRQAGPATQIKASIEYLENQLDQLTRQANQAGVPLEFRR